MPNWDAYSFVFGPLMAFFIVGLFALILRWAFAPGSSLVTAPIRPSDPTDYGLLDVVCLVKDPHHGAAQVRELAAQGVKANLIYTTAGLALMVWPKDLQKAKEVLSLG